MVCPVDDLFVQNALGHRLATRHFPTLNPVSSTAIQVEKQEQVHHICLDSRTLLSVSRLCIWRRRKKDGVVGGEWLDVGSSGRWGMKRQTPFFWGGRRGFRLAWLQHPLHCPLHCPLSNLKPPNSAFHTHQTCPQPVSASSHCFRRLSEPATAVI